MHPISLIAVPSGPFAEDLFITITKKMEPLWAGRSAFRVDLGTAIELQDGGWRISIGDLRITAGPGQGRTRGVLVQVQKAYGSLDEDEDDDHDRAQEEPEDEATQERRYERMFRAFFDAMIRGTEISTEGLRSIVRVPGVGTKELPEMALVKQYMEMLRFGRIS